MSPVLDLGMDKVCPAKYSTRPSPLASLNIPDRSIDASFEPNIKAEHRVPGQVERHFKAVSDLLSNEELYRQHVEAEKSVVTKYELIPVPGFFHMPRAGKKDHTMHEWVNGSGVSSVPEEAGELMSRTSSKRA